MADNVGEQTFKQMWLEARIRFEETTKKSLVQSKNQSLDGVLRELDMRFNDHSAEDGSKKRRMKELASNVLTFIELLGGIAAQGASIVFGPANLCFNALQSLIAIPAAISKFHDDLALLFGEISTFMKQFKIYERIEQYAQVDTELKEITHKLMITFVDTCALSIEILSGSSLKKFKTKAKLVLFDNDSGVQAQLDKFKRLVAHQSQISDAVTLEHILKSESEVTDSLRSVVALLKRSSEDSRKLLEAKSQEIQDELKDTHQDVKTVKAGTETLVKDVIDRTSIKKHQDYFDQICRKLSVTSETIQNLEKDADQIRKDSLQDTGLWLEGIDVYKVWVDFASDPSSLLLLSGNSGSGKSNLAFSILDRLRIRYSPTRNPMRVSLAAYRFQRMISNLEITLSKTP